MILQIQSSVFSTFRLRKKSELRSCMFEFGSNYSPKHRVQGLQFYLDLCLSLRLRFLRLCFAILNRRFFFTEDIQNLQKCYKSFYTTRL